MSDPRVTLITGATGQLGEAVARAFLGAGDLVVLSGRNRERLNALHGTLEPFERVEINVSDPGHHDGAKALVDDVLHRRGRIDCLLHLVGGFDMKKVTEADAADWDAVMQANAFSAAYLLKFVLPGMVERGYGKAAFVSSVSAASPPAGLGPYAASKMALEAIVKASAREVRDSNVNVNAAAITTLDTDEARKSMPKTDPSHFIAPADLANVLLFLCSDAAPAINGAIVPVTGKATFDVRL